MDYISTLLESILKVKERRGKRTREVVFDKPENSILSTRQFIIAISIVILAIGLVIKYLVLE